MRLQVSFKTVPLPAAVARFVCEHEDSAANRNFVQSVPNNNHLQKLEAFTKEKLETYFKYICDFIACNND